MYFICICHVFYMYFICILYVLCMYYICILYVYLMYILCVHTNFIFEQENEVHEDKNYYPPKKMVVLSAIHAALNPCKLKQTF